MSDRLDAIYADTTHLGRARYDLFSIGSQDMPVDSEDVLIAMAAFELAVREDEQQNVVGVTQSGAWAEIVNADGSDEWLAKCSAALAEVQSETARRNAEKIRRHEWALGCAAGCCDIDTGAQAAADFLWPRA